MIFGIAYHSPLDVLVLIPQEFKITTKLDVEADVLFSETKQNLHKARIQIIFTSDSILKQMNIKILDVADLTKLDFTKLLSKK